MEGHQPGRVQATAVTSEAGCLVLCQNVFPEPKHYPEEPLHLSYRNNLRPLVQWVFSSIQITLQMVGMHIQNVC